jgi:hypothetical protein
VTLYQAIAHRVGSPEAQELGRQLSSWHDRMVAHERVRTPSARSVCDDTCPHAESIEFWHAALQILGEAADRLSFLKSTAARAQVSVARAGTAEQPSPVAAASDRVAHGLQPVGWRGIWS